MTGVQTCALPIFDGGLVNPVPVSLCRALDAEIVIAVDLSMDMLTTLQRRNGKPAVAGGGWRNTVGRWFGGGEEKPILPSLADVVSNSIAIMQGRISRSRLAGEPADVLIAPRLGQLNLLDYHRGSEAIAAGRKATEHMLPLLHSLLD